MAHNQENEPPEVWLQVKVNDREIPWLTKLAELVLGPFMRTRAARRQRLWKPEMERIERELEVELPDGRSHPQFRERVGERFAAWLEKHPESAP